MKPPRYDSIVEVIGEPEDWLEQFGRRLRLDDDGNPRARVFECDLAEWIDTDETNLSMIPVRIAKRYVRVDDDEVEIEATLIGMKWIDGRPVASYEVNG